MTSQSLRGLFAAVLTPMRDDGTIDTPTLASHCRALIDEGCHGVSLFGTTGEGPALSVEERMAGLEAVIEGGIPATRILPGTGCAAGPDTVRLTRHALAHGCSNVLIMPPFFFKVVSDDGVAATYARIIEAVGDPALRIYIYNFPAVTGVWVREAAVGRLIATYPDTIAGVKDSSGDWSYVSAILERFPGVAVFTGWETLMPKLLAAGGAGNISGLANVIPGVLRALYDSCAQTPDDELLSGVTKLVEGTVKFPSVPAIKALAANLRHAPAWRNMRPPLVPLAAESERILLTVYDDALGRNMIERRSGGQTTVS